MIIRLSQKLSKKIKEPDLLSLPAHKNPFLDWHAHLFTCHRTQYLIICNSQTLFSTVFYGKGIHDLDPFMSMFMDILRDILEEVNAQLIYNRIITPNVTPLELAKMQDKRVIGSMNDQINMAKAHLEDGETSPYDASFKINQNWLSYLKYKRPVEAFLGMKV